LFDEVAGILLREASPAVVVSARYLYPRALGVEKGGIRQHAFMLLLEPRPAAGGDQRAVAGEYDRLQQWYSTAWPIPRLAAKRRAVRACGGGALGGSIGRSAGRSFA
jgi:hypothetical protein